MAAMVEEEELLLQDQGRLDDAGRLKLISFMKKMPCLWSSGKFTKTEKNKAVKELEEEFNYEHTGEELMSVWKSMRASMLREVKRVFKQKEYKSSWKFYQCMLFLKPVLDKMCQKAEEWTDEEKRTLINYYNENPSLWNHKLKDYHDKARREVLLEKLRNALEDKYETKEIISTWNNLKTYYDKERLREEGSKVSGTGTSQVIYS